MIARASDNDPALRIGGGLVFIAALLGIAGCAAGPLYPETAPEPAVAVNGSVYVYPAAPQVLTEDSISDVLARYRGQPLVVCIWKADDPGAVSGLHDAANIQAQYPGSRILGVNLDPPDTWLSAAVPVLRQAQARFPMVAIQDAERAAVLQRLGLQQIPASLTFLVLDAGGRQIALRKAFEPPRLTLQQLPAPATVPIATVAPATMAATQPELRQQGRTCLIYRLRVVRIADNGVISELNGIGLAEDVKEAIAGQAGNSEIAGWLKMLGLEVAGRVKRGERVAVAPLRCSGSGFGATDGNEAGLSFSQALTVAVGAAGRGVVGPFEVANTLRALGIGQELLESKPSWVGPNLLADYLVIGTVSILKTAE